MCDPLSRQIRLIQCRLTAGLCLLLLTAAGCGKTAATGTESGTVSLDGSALVEGHVMFQEAVRGEGASAEVKDGAFEFPTPLNTGDYKVYVQHPAPPGPTAASPATSLSMVRIPDRYLLGSNSSPLNATVEEGKNSFEF